MAGPSGVALACLITTTVTGHGAKVRLRPAFPAKGVPAFLARYPLKPRQQAWSQNRGKVSLTKGPWVLTVCASQPSIEGPPILGQADGVAHVGRCRVASRCDAWGRGMALSGGLGQQRIPPKDDAGSSQRPIAAPF